MATVELTKDNFEETVGGNDVVFVDFWASWCGPCRMFAPIFEEVSGDNADVVFAKVDTEAQPELAGAFQIQSIPTLMVFKENVPVFSQPGALPKAVLEDLVAQAKDLDMAPVHEAIAQERAEAEQTRAG